MTALAPDLAEVEGVAEAEPEAAAELEAAELEAGADEAGAEELAAELLE